MTDGHRGPTTTGPTSSGSWSGWSSGKDSARRRPLLGVNRKTVALALQRERLTGRMTLAVRRLMANLDDSEWERTTPVDRLEAKIQVALEVAHELAALVESLTQRVEALEAAQKPEDDAGGEESADAPDAEGRGLRLFNWRRRRQPQGEEKSDG